MAEPSLALLHTQAFERYMNQYGSDLIRTYNQFNGEKLRQVDVYVDPHEGKLRVDIVLENGSRLPLLADIDPDWEKIQATEYSPEELDNLQKEAVKGAASERSTWED